MKNTKDILFFSTLAKRTSVIAVVLFCSTAFIHANAGPLLDNVNDLINEEIQTTFEIERTQQTSTNTSNHHRNLSRVTSSRTDVLAQKGIVDNGENFVFIEQSALSSGSIHAEQQGEANLLNIIQDGNNNRIHAEQKSDAYLDLGNLSGQSYDTSLGNYATLEQYGNNNDIELTQVGHDNQAEILQNNDGNSAELIQVGVGLNIRLEQTGNESIKVTQTGYGYH